MKWAHLALLLMVPLGVGAPGCLRPSSQHFVRDIDLEDPDPAPMYGYVEQLDAIKYSKFEHVPEPAPLHAAVWEYLFNRPELPFVEGLNDPVGLEYHHALAQAVAPLANQDLGEKGMIWYQSKPHGCEFAMWTSAKSKMIVIQLVMFGGDTNTKFFGYDMSRVPGAFDPEADLDVQTVARYARPLREGS